MHCVSCINIDIYRAPLCFARGFVLCVVSQFVIEQMQMQSPSAPTSPREQVRRHGARLLLRPLWRGCSYDRRCPTSVPSRSSLGSKPAHAHHAYHRPRSPPQTDSQTRELSLLSASRPRLSRPQAAQHECTVVVHPNTPPACSTRCRYPQKLLSHLLLCVVGSLGMLSICSRRTLSPPSYI
jgi:hypothetical protein